MHITSFAFGKRLTGVEKNIEGLGVVPETGTLEITPLITNSTKGALLSVFGYFDMLRQRGLIIHIQLDENILTIDDILHLWGCPYFWVLIGGVNADIALQGAPHKPGVIYATKAKEINEDVRCKM